MRTCLAGRRQAGWAGCGVSDPRAGLVLAERLQVHLGRLVHDLSRGNKQKLGVGPVLMHTPALALLDEPTRGLDPVSPSTR